MNIELLKVIISLCQVTGSYASTSVATSGQYRNDREDRIEFTYQQASDAQLRCQKYYIKCMSKDGFPTLDKCILERK